MRIQHNIMAMSAYRNYTNNVSAMKKNLEKLSSGYKINRAGDDAAGLAISEKMRAQITGLETAQKNAKDGISLVQTAEGALTEVHDMLNRMVELATQSANGTYDNETDRAQLQKELEQLRSEINRIADSSNFNGIKLLDGSMSASGASGMKTMLDASALPVEGPDLGKDTVIHNEANGSGGTQFSIDLHDLELSNASGGTFTLSVGTGANKMEIVFAGVAASTAATKVNGSAIIASLLAGTAGDGNFKVASITVGTTAVNASAISASNGELTLTGTQFGDIKLSKGSAGSNRLTFTQVDAPTDKAQVWKPAGSVHVKGSAAGKLPDNAHPHMDEGFLVDSLSANPDIMTQASVQWSASVSVGSKTAAIGGDGTTLAAAFASVADGASITLTCSSSQWSIKAGSVTVTVASASFSGSTVTLKNSAGATLLTVSVASATKAADIEGLFGSATKIGTVSAAEDPGSSTPTSPATIDSFGSTGKAAVDAITNANGSYATVATAAASATLSAVVSASAATIIGALASAGVQIGSNGAAALNGKQIKVGDLTATLATSAVKATTTASAALKAIVNALNKAAAAKASADYANLGSKGGTITIYSDFKFVNNTGSVVAQDLANDGVKLTYTTNTVTLGNNAATTPSTSGGIDYQFETTAVKYVDMDGGDRLASTHLTSDKWMDKVADGNTMTIASQEITFTTDEKLAKDHDEQYVFIGKDGKADAQTIARRISWAARNNQTYTVGADDKGDLSFTEIRDQQFAVGADNKSSLTSREAIANTLGFTTGKIAADSNRGLTLQIGDTADSYNQLKVDIGDMHTSALGIADISIATQEDAAEAISAIKAAINTVSDVRGTLGATQNRLDHTINNLSVMTENIQDAESTIRDTDVAEEMMAYTKNNILIQSAQAMLAQANQVPQGVLQLLQ